MKSPVMLLIFSVLPLFIPAFAQNLEKFEPGDIRIGNDVYSIVFINENNLISVENTSKNVNLRLMPRIDPDLRLIPSGIQIDIEKERRIIFELLAEKLPRLKEKNEFIRISYTFNARGNVIILDFAFADTTIMTPKELAMLDQCLRKEIKATFSGQIHKEQKYFYAGIRPTIYF